LEFDRMTKLTTPTPFIVNPLFCANWSDTATNCVAALESILALDGSRLTDRARTYGVAMLLEPIIGALDGAIELEADCLTLRPDETERLRALAADHHRGSVRDALDVALNLAEATAAQPKPEPTREEMAAIWRRLADQADAELAKLAEADQGSLTQVVERVGPEELA
jgi:hypothetical protein